MADPKLYRRGDVWWARILGKRVTTGCKDRQAALLRARVLEREHADPAHRAANEATLGDALVAFLADRDAHGRSKGTLHCYRIKVRHLGAVLGVTLPLAQVTAERVDGYTRRRLDDGASRNTIGKELTVLRGVLKLPRPTDLPTPCPHRWGVVVSAAAHRIHCRVHRELQAPGKEAPRAPRPEAQQRPVDMAPRGLRVRR